jgi:hypothetical protein
MLQYSNPIQIYNVLKSNVSHMQAR